MNQNSNKYWTRSTESQHIQNKRGKGKEGITRPILNNRKIVRKLKIRCILVNENESKYILVNDSTQFKYKEK